MKELVLAGIALVFLGVLLIFAGSILKARETETEVAGIIMIGPVPVMFGDKKMLLPLAVLAIILTIVFYLFFWRH